VYEIRFYSPIKCQKSVAKAEKTDSFIPGSKAGVIRGVKRAVGSGHFVATDFNPSR